jgi:hypothetical protein
VVLADAFGDLGVVDRATRHFEAIIAAQRAAGGAAGDHFAAAGASSAFGRAMEEVDRSAMSAAVYPALRAMADAGAAPSMIANVVAACAEGYSFPTNLDLDQPVNGLAPTTQAEILGQAVAEGWSRRRLETELDAWSARRQTRRAEAIS